MLQPEWAWLCKEEIIERLTTCACRFGNKIDESNGVSSEASAFVVCWRDARSAHLVHAVRAAQMAPA